MLGRIPHTRNMGLEEAEAAIRAPVIGGTSFPFREHKPEPRSTADGNKGTRRWLPSGTEEDPNKTKGHQRTDPGAGGTSSRSPGTTGVPSAAAPPPAKRGIHRPAHASGVQKYGKIPNRGPVHHLLLTHLKNNSSLRLDAHYRTVCLDLVIASLAKSTWQRYDSAFRMWKRFCSDCGLKVDITDFTMYKRNFILWCWEKSNLAVGSIKTYLGVLKRVNHLANSLGKDEGDLEGV